MKQTDMNTTKTYAPSFSAGAASMDVSAQETLAFLVQNGMIDLGDVQEQMRQKEREELLMRCHSYDIWEGKDGRWRTYITDETRSHNRRMVAKSSRKALEEFLVEHYQGQTEEEQRKRCTLRTLYPEWLEYKRLHTTAGTYITRINSDWKTYYLDTDIIEIPLCKLDKLTLDNWAHKLIQDYEMTKNQYFNVTVIMRQGLAYAVDKGIISDNPFAGVKVDGKRLFRKVKKKPDQTQVYSKEEMKQITEMAWEDFHNQVKVYELTPLAVLFQFQTGIRIGEVVTVKFSDIEKPDYIHIQRMVRRDEGKVVEHPKTDCGDREVFLTSAAKEIIRAAKERQRELHAENEYIFSINGKPPTERSVATLYTKYCKKMGIIQKSSHKARKTYVSSLIDGGVNINTVRESAGHASEKTTLRNYTFDRSGEDEKREKFEKALAV